jgi:hypothetical protein
MRAEGLSGRREDFHLNQWRIGEQHSLRTISGGMHRVPQKITSPQNFFSNGVHRIFTLYSS